jgi:hypothetical protein
VLVLVHSEQLIDPVFYLRRRGTVRLTAYASFFVFAGLEGTYAVTSTATGAIYSSYETRPAFVDALTSPGNRQCVTVRRPLHE